MKTGMNLSESNRLEELNRKYEKDYSDALFKKVLTRKICFRNLSWGLKIPIIMSWIIGILYLIAFLIGFTIGVAGL